jgi:lipoate-protein ligase A
VHWRFLASPPLGGAENMALDEALLMRAAATGEAVFRVYSWSTPTLSLGRNQPARDDYDRDALARRGIDVVRRLTGGRAVLHHREVTYSVAAPIALGATLRDAYLRINEILVAALHALGAPAELAAPAAHAPHPSLAPCFEEPTEGELVLRGRKLVGSAQYREGDALLQHGSILVDDDQTGVSTLLRVPVPAPPPPATLREALGTAPSAERMAAALLDAVRSREDREVEPLVVDGELERETRERARRYRDPAWTWRR